MQRVRAFIGGAVIGALGGLIGLGGAEFRLPLLIGAFRFGALDAVILNKAMSLVVVATALPFRVQTVPLIEISAHWPVVVNLLAGSLLGAWFGAGWATRLRSETLYRVTFTELFIAATVIAAASYRFGWRSVALGSLLGAAGVVVLAWLLQIAAYRVALHWLDWGSALLLLGFGLYLTYECVTGLGQMPAAGPQTSGSGWAMPLNAGGIGVAAWALAAEGLEILVVWLGVSLREGPATATLGVGLGLTVIVLLGVALRGTRVFRRVPPYVLDGIAAVMVTTYGFYFLHLAVTASGA